MTRSRLLALLAAGLVAAGCASTSLKTQWSDPALAQAKFDKVLVAFQTKDEALRRALEDTMARSIPNATASYKVLGDDEVQDVKKAAARLKAAGFDSAVVMRMISVEKEQTWVPGTIHVGPAPYGRLWGGWSHGWGRVYDPGYLRTDKVVTVGTTAYTLADEKLVWASRSETFNPGDPVKLIEEVVKANAEAARKDIRR